MPSSRDSIGVLREVSVTKNIPTKIPVYKKPNILRDAPLDLDTVFNSDLENCTSLVSNLILGDKKKTKKKCSMTFKKLESHMNSSRKNMAINFSVVENSSISKMLAIMCLANGNELEGCCHLIESHATCLRMQIFYRNVKSKLRNNVLSEPMVNNLDPKDLDIDFNSSKMSPKTLISTLEELPSEWYIVQITAQHEHIKDLRHRIQPEDAMYSMKPSHGLHVTVLLTGANAMSPICITLPKPNANSNYDIRTEIESLLNTNKSNLTATYNNHNLYWKMRKKQNEKMNTAISELEFSWLREWRILLLSDYIEHLDLVDEIHKMVDKLIADSKIKDMSERTRWLLRKIATGACYLQPHEIERAVKYILPGQLKLAKNLILSIVAKAKVMDLLKTAKRKPLVMILDEVLDHISFESIQLLKHHPVTRFPSLHIAYALYKQHKNSMKDGYKIIRKSDNLGTFIVNPSLDLAKMEMRIKSFLNYWLPKWKGLYGIKPDLEFFKNALTQHNILMYNGHGSGIQFLRGEEIEKMRVKASVLLFGCSSIKLAPVGGRLPAYGISNQYLMGCSPCILGMLWEVTDGDIDRMTAQFMSSWISSAGKKSWSDVDKTSWFQGEIEFTNSSKTKTESEENMLVAVAKSKDVCGQYMTSAAIIVRGLPVKLID